MSEMFKFSFIACFVVFVSAIGTTIYLSALPELSLIFNVSSTHIKFSITIYFIGFMIGAFLSGPLSDVYGRRKVISFFLILFTISSLLCGLSSSILSFLESRFIQGIGAAGSVIIIPAIITDSYKGHYFHKIISLALAVTAIGPGISPIIGGIIFHVFGWQMIFYFLTFLGALALLLSYSVRFCYQTKKQEFKDVFYGYQFFIRHPFFRHYWIMIGVLYGAFYAFIIISPYVFRLHYGWSILEFTMVGIALALGNSLGALLDDELIEKVGSRKIIFGGLVAIAFSLCMLFFVELLAQDFLSLILAMFFIISGSLISSCLTLKAMKVKPKFSGIASSLINLGRVLSASLVLLIILLLPETMFSVNYFIFLALLVCIFGYLKIRKAL